MKMSKDSDATTPKEVARTPATSAPEGAANPGAPRQRPARTCYNCGEEGHLSRGCPKRQSSDATGGDGNGRTVRANGVGYETGETLPSRIELGYKDRVWSCELDSGAVCSLVPKDFVKKEQVAPATEKLRALGGHSLNVIGKVEVQLEMNGRELDTPLLVVDGIDYPILGIDWMRRHCVMWDFETDTVLINGVEVFVVAPEPPVELDAGASSANGQHPEPPMGQASQRLRDAAICAVKSSGWEEQRKQRDEAAETELLFAVARKAIDRFKRQRGGRGRLRAGMHQRVCYRCHEGGHQVRHCPYDPQRGCTDRTAGDSEASALTGQGVGGRRSAAPGGDSGGHRRGCYRCGGKHLVRSCPDRGGGVSPTVRSGRLGDGQVMTADAEGASMTDAAIRRWGVFGQRDDVGPEGSCVFVGEQVPWGWSDGQGYP